MFRNETEACFLSRNSCVLIDITNPISWFLIRHFMTTILFIDDDNEQRRSMAHLAASLGYKVLEAASVNAARGLLTSRTDAAKGVNLLIIDAAMAQGEGALMHLCGRAVSVIISVSARDSSKIAGLMQAGAVDFVPKPINPERLQVSIANAIRAQSLAYNAWRAQTLSMRQTEHSDIVAGDPVMARALSVASRAAKADVPVLIEGEAGTGRETFARLIHADATGGDDRRARPFVVLRCQVESTESLEQGLFAARVREAQSGTLYLDDVDALSPILQEQLMRLVSDVDELERGRKGGRTDIRVIASTRTSLLDRVRGGAFREDLFYRFNVLPITLPPLRTRRSDIASLIYLFVSRFATSEGKVIQSITPEAMAMLGSYAWPGNVAELENAAFRAVVLAENTSLGVEEFPQIATRVAAKADNCANYARHVPFFTHASSINTSSVTGSASKSSGGHLLASAAKSRQASDPFAIPLVDSNGDMRSLEDLETDVIQFAIRHYRGRMSEVSRRLGIGRSTLYRKVRDFCFDKTEQEEKDADFMQADLKTAAGVNQETSRIAT